MNLKSKRVLQKQIYIILYFLVFSISPSAFGQVLQDFNDFTLFWGDEHKSKSSIESLGSLQDSNILCVQDKTAFLKIVGNNQWQYSFDLIQNGTIPKFSSTHFFGLGKTSSLVNYTVLGNRVLGLSYRPSFMGNQPTLFYHFINPKIPEKNNYGFPIDIFKGIKGKFDLNRLQMRTEKNGNYASVFYVPRTNETVYPNVEFAIFNKDLKAPSIGNFVYPFSTDDFKVLDFFILNDSSQICIVGNYTKEDEHIKQKEATQFYKSIHIIPILKGIAQKPIIIEDPATFYLDIKAFSFQNNIYLTGIYTTSTQSTIQGILTVKIDAAGTIINKKFSLLSPQFHRTMKEYMKNNLYKESHYQAESSKFNILNFEKVAGGFIQLAEFKSIEYRYNSSDFYGGSSSVDTYYWSNNIIATKIDTNGTIIWCRIIPKIQRTVNDYGYYLSTAIYATQKEIHLFFNDNLDNYDENNIYSIKGDVPEPASFSASKNTISHVKLNCETGKIVRKSTLGKEETDVIFVPKLAVPIPNEKKLYIYGRKGNKQRIGSLTFR